MLFNSMLVLCNLRNGARKPRMNCQPFEKQGRIHDYPSRVPVGMGSDKKVKYSGRSSDVKKIEICDGPTDGPADRLSG